MGHVRVGPSPSPLWLSLPGFKSFRRSRFDHRGLQQNCRHCEAGLEGMHSPWAMILQPRPQPPRNPTSLGRHRVSQIQSTCVFLSSMTLPITITGSGSKERGVGLSVKTVSPPVGVSFKLARTGVRPYNYAGNGRVGPCVCPVFFRAGHCPFSSIKCSSYSQRATPQSSAPRPPASAWAACARFPQQSCRRHSAPSSRTSWLPRL